MFCSLISDPHGKVVIIHSCVSLVLMDEIYIHIKLTLVTGLYDNFVPNCTRRTKDLVWEEKDTGANMYIALFVQYIIF